MLFRIDPTSGDPLYAQLAAQVRTAVAHDELRPGERLPSARDLAASLDVNLHTVLHAYQELRDEGVIELRRGRGAVVTGSGAPDLTDLHAAVDALVVAARRLRVAPETVTALVKEALR
ncbi:GntR family transcriptional regulator [Cellulomonas wangsupingiae]|uniref:GntR family transcriptional regulator n=1 Tax=Cellulomonas wangsupingiae TaxID=2968085 RepID=A0ABY5K938_9CELL|nr:GntR family transcriptional regulator [Cellulomonas wangsupingiae]MCC2334584.1 GntR family transcriptional regulator [Cellulomonas wangsupingiae]MCM0638695.1 GntR family transcriptional regulator [Cellulomonas wangsupingiae]UUI66450.1 GntR family transcriptional regulator [Cellulomonas wangsupingiae]